ncbi:HDOD domain-containing protein [Pseudomonas aeruginosa]|uniref:HDOD domain-containing protein n=1 Tax=Pseudomonas aeruginosa TaxID=287 RepID=UPI00155E3572|nr:HDOD domain-containing protein [Pseudomonas aeruginosa]
MSRKHNLSPVGEGYGAQIKSMPSSLDDVSEQTLRALLKAVEDDEIALPSLPEVALKVREAAELPDVTIPRLAGVIGTDTALTARMLKVVNSPLLRSGWEVTDLQAAIGRLGVIYTSNLSVGLAMEQMFRSKSKALDRKLREVWRKSLVVAGVCHAICKRRSDLSADQAILAGLVHMIGVLPILTYIDKHSLHVSPAELDYVINHVHPVIGHRILSQWGFPAQLADVPSSFSDLSRGSEQLDYVDVVQAACIISNQGSSGPFGDVDWEKSHALQALGLKRSDVGLYLEGASVLAG